MATANSNSREDQFAYGMPNTNKRCISARIANANTDTAVGANGLEKDVESRVPHWIAAEVGRFCDGNKQHCKRNPPNIMA